MRIAALLCLLTMSLVSSFGQNDNMLNRMLEECIIKSKNKYENSPFLTNKDKPLLLCCDGLPNPFTYIENSKLFYEKIGLQTMSWNNTKKLRKELRRGINVMEVSPNNPFHDNWSGSYSQHAYEPRDFGILQLSDANPDIAWMEANEMRGGIRNETIGVGSPVYDMDGVLLGTTKEGFTGQVLIYNGSEDIDFSSLSEIEALSYETVDTYDNIRNELSEKARSNIWTNIKKEGNIHHTNDSIIVTYVNFSRLNKFLEYSIIYSPSNNCLTIHPVVNKNHVMIVQDDDKQKFISFIDGFYISKKSAIIERKTLKDERVEYDIPRIGVSCFNGTSKTLYSQTYLGDGEYELVFSPSFMDFQKLLIKLVNECDRNYMTPKPLYRCRYY